MTISVVQWATGGVGRHAVKMLSRHPEMRIVAGVVHDDAKVGRDIGEITGIGPIGAECLSSKDLDAVCALDADVVSYMPLPAAQAGDDPERDHEVICRLLASGKDVVTTVGYVHPKAYGPEVLARLEAACAEGSSTLHGTGLNPGFMGELVPLLLSGLCASVERVLVRESSEFSRYPSPAVITGMMGFGLPPDEYERHAARYRRWLSGLFKESVVLVADGIGAPIDDVVVEEEVEVADARYEIAAGPIEAGTVAGQRWAWRGMVGTTPVVELEAVYRAHPAIAPSWPAPGWVTKVDGRPSMTLEVGHWISSGLLGTAAHAVNAIPHVVRAAPGILTFLDLPPVTGRYVPR